MCFAIPKSCELWSWREKKFSGLGFEFQLIPEFFYGLNFSLGNANCFSSLPSLFLETAAFLFSTGPQNGILRHFQAAGPV